MLPMAPVERVEAPSFDEFRERYVERSRPVILRGVIDAWPALRTWSVEHFERRFGDRILPAARRKGEHGYFDPKRGVNYEKVRFADYLAGLSGERGADRYMVFPVHEHLPELFDDIARPLYCRDARWFRARFWFAANGTQSVLHRDLPQNLYAQIVGRKRFVLVDRREHRRVHAYPLHSGVPNYARVDAESPDLDKHPRFRDTARLVCDLDPGELLYIPSLWWHQARALSMSVSVNLWWANGPLYLAVKAAEAFSRVRDLKL